MEPIMMEAVIGGMRNRTATALLLAHDDYWDGRNRERRGRNTFLYRTPRGRYFAQHQTRWQGEEDRIVPLSLNDAQKLYEELPRHALEYEEAFPGAEVPDA